MPDSNPPCNCGSQKSYSQCCAPYHKNLETPTTAAALMRSRYSAFCRHLSDYLIQTHHHSKRSMNDKSSLRENFSKTKWCKLEIVDTDAGLQNDQEGWVEFRATFFEGRKYGQLHERSRFIKESGKWFYIDGEIKNTSPITVGRNEPCLCGSGRKYKKCCGP